MNVHFLPPLIVIFSQHFSYSSVLFFFPPLFFARCQCLITFVDVWRNICSDLFLDFFLSPQADSLTGLANCCRYKYTHTRRYANCTPIYTIHIYRLKCSTQPLFFVYIFNSADTDSAANLHSFSFLFLLLIHCPSLLFLTFTAAFLPLILLFQLQLTIPFL